MNQIAIKNLQGLNDILDAEKLMHEKLETYASTVSDGNLKTLITDMKTACEEHYYAVYNYLKSHK